MQGLDYVISEAKKYGIYLVLSLVNNFESFGGRTQYIQWARDEGRHLSSDDDFYRDEVVKSYYKNHVRVTLLPSLYILLFSLHGGLGLSHLNGSGNTNQS